MSQTDRRPFETSSLLTFFRSSWRRSLRVCSLIIEGPFNYTNGPTVWPEGPTYGFITVPAAGYKKDVDCPAVPDDSPLKPLEGSAVNPYSMFSVETPIDECLLSCNKTAVALTGEDPCAAGGITDPSFNSMGCYDIGTMAPKDMGVCGYNCSVLHGDIDTPTMCTAEDAASGNWDDCYIYCDTRTFPGTAAPAAHAKAEAPPRAAKTEGKAGGLVTLPPLDDPTGNPGDPCDTWQSYNCTLNENLDCEYRSGNGGDLGCCGCASLGGCGAGGGQACDCC